jgi:hypothetical protein
MLGLGSYRTAWFMAHRIREAMGFNNEAEGRPLGGANKVVEVDETYVGGKAKNRAFKESAPKKAIVTLDSRKPAVADHPWPPERGGRHYAHDRGAIRAQGVRSPARPVSASQAASPG